MPSLEDDNPELKDFNRRFWWTLPFTIVVTVLAMFGHQLGWFSMTAQTWIELVLSIPVVLWAGQPFFVRGWKSVINRSPNMWTLIGLGTAAAFIYSVVATVAPGVFPETFMSMGRIDVSFEAERKRVVKGKSVAVRGDLGGRRFIRKKKTKDHRYRD